MKEWDAFLKAVEKVTSDIDEPFFRGHPESNWSLTPSLGRYSLHRHFENNSYYEFLTYGASLLPQNADSWDTLFIMRHHGIPTRLLDWTQSFSAAVFFALKGCSVDGAIWILDPYKLNLKTIKDDAILHPHTDFEYKYYDYFIRDSRKRFPGEAIAILPNKTTPRVLAQRGAFTIHKHRDTSLNSVCPSALTKIVLPRAAQTGAHDFLKLAGVNEFTLFPDLDGLARWLRQDHGVDTAKLRPSRLRLRKRHPR